jgi:deoxyribodipyrimidine photo-lyase
LKIDERVRKLNDAEVRPKARYVLYWAQMNRRVECNHALAYAIDVANQAGLPVLFYEGLTCSYPYANDRLHTFILEGVPDNAEAARALGAGYAFYLRRTASHPDNIVYELAKDAAAIVTDDYPTFIAARHNASVPRKLDVAYFSVDSSCIVPMSRIESRQYAAYTIRPRIHRLLPDYLRPFGMPAIEHPWRGKAAAWHTEVTPESIASLVASCEIDHTVKPSTAYRGGTKAARERLQHFVERNLRNYAKGRNEPSAHATSNMSPYLHFGHISALEAALAARRSPEFLEELIVRRELAFNFARFTTKHDSLVVLPDWVQQTLGEHARDERDPSYAAAQMEKAETYDPLWNATQRELLLRGKIHGYYRMYWGKKIIEWSKTYAAALKLMIYLHDRYALDGRDPNTYTNILWCFGLHDRPWFERPVFGKVRYMSYEGMKRKTDVNAYLKEIEYIAQTGKDPERL